MTKRTGRCSGSPRSCCSSSSPTTTCRSLDPSSSYCTAGGGRRGTRGTLGTPTSSSAPGRPWCRPTCTWSGMSSTTRRTTRSAPARRWAARARRPDLARTADPRTLSRGSSPRSRSSSSRAGSGRTPSARRTATAATTAAPTAAPTRSAPTCTGRRATDAARLVPGSASPSAFFRTSAREVAAPRGLSCGSIRCGGPRLGWPANF
mmetsp:Transcript_46822/g.131686  ORF Transcript_46822/g.131686 Transcript_46822/m.131686 type:complete len:205 (+) Transcript_46822:679-1293(+)